ELSFKIRCLLQHNLIGFLEIQYGHKMTVFVSLLEIVGIQDKESYKEREGHPLSNPSPVSYLEYNSTISCSLMFSGTLSRSGAAMKVPFSSFSLKSIQLIRG